MAYRLDEQTLFCKTSYHMIFYIFQNKLPGFIKMCSYCFVVSYKTIFARYQTIETNF